jgi:hypothetical protein
MDYLQGGSVKPAQSAGLTRRGTLPPTKKSFENYQFNDFAFAQ